MFNSSLPDRVYNHIVEQIFHCRYRQGDRILEVDVAKELNISIVPVREALLRLHQEGWIVRIAKRGTFVADLRDSEKRYELSKIRQAMEIGLFWGLARSITKEQIAELESIVERLENAMKSGAYHDYWEADVEFHLRIAEFSAGIRGAELFRTVFMQCVVFCGEKWEDVEGHGVEALRQDISHHSLLNALASHDSALASRLIAEHATFWQEEDL